jgi:type II secretory pathway pseudopilin PulG
MVELMVVVIIIGILAAVAIPKYLRSVENGKADAAVAQLKMVGAANRMYAIDHNGYYVTGGAVVNSAACSNTCPTTCPVSDLVGCKYLPSSSYATMSYQIAAAGSGSNAGSTCPLGVTGNALVACVLRAAGPAAPYNDWGYTMDVNGTVLCYDGATVGCGGTNGPPAPAQ